MTHTTRFGSVRNRGDGNVVSQGNAGTERITVGPDRTRTEPSIEDPRPGRNPIDPDPTRNVFVVHGRDEQVRREMFGLLRALNLRPLEWEDLVGFTGQATPFLGEVVAAAPAQAQAALVLLTPDDVVRLHPSLLKPEDPDDERLPTGQPRPNVLLELGMVLMAYPQRTVIVEFGPLRRIADLAGRNVIRFNGTVEAVRKVAARLELAGCPVKDTGVDWLDVSVLSRLDAFNRDRTL
ncbi:nucleotide-binding protein [Actinospica durhamensis]|uniref:Nucleotide-binding protein n=1 Tax=Actinospica durhamensis TaxID=1508375 RepID=A0A941EZS2_9ACTN|nr:nucleotide-binding protein [Actinospica durhamensis]MBR7838314.1 nucleotide-binding protein [Actinospica durhamensis]